MFHLEVTTYCNQSCVFCYRNVVKKKMAAGQTVPEHEKLNQHMGFDLFQSLVMKIRDFCEKSKIPKNIIVHGLGEAVLWPHYKKGIQMCRDLGFETQLFTNGVFLTEEWCHFLLENITEKLKVSVNGLTGETLEAVTKTRRSRKTIENCRMLVRVAREKKIRPRQITFGFVKCKENEHEAEQFRKLWEKDRDIVDVMTPNAINFEVEKATASPDVRGVCPAGIGPSRLRVVIDGTLHPCCHTNELALGDLKKQSIDECLEGPMFKKLLRLNQGGRLGMEPVCNVTCLAGSRHYPEGRPRKGRLNRAFRVFHRASNIFR